MLSEVVDWSEAKRLIGRPQEALLCAKAKRQQQSAQSERKSINPSFCWRGILFFSRTS